jgi:hypothetical protein
MKKNISAAPQNGTDAPHCEVSDDGSVSYFLSEGGARHRVGGPAVLRTQGNSEWWEQGELIRTSDKPHSYQDRQDMLLGWLREFTDEQGAAAVDIVAMTGIYSGLISVERCRSDLKKLAALGKIEQVDAECWRVTAEKG